MVLTVIELRLIGNSCYNHVECDPDSSKHIVDLDEDGDLIVARRTSKLTCILFIACFYLSPWGDGWGARIYHYS